MMVGGRQCFVDSSPCSPRASPRTTCTPSETISPVNLSEEGNGNGELCIKRAIDPVAVTSERASVSRVVVMIVTCFRHLRCPTR